MHFATLGLADLEVRLNFFELHRRIDRTDIGIFVERIADDQRLHAVFKLGYDLVRDRFLHQQSGTSAAHVALIKEDAIDDAFHCLVYRRIRKNDICCLTAKLQRVFLVRTRERALDDSSNVCRTRKCNLVYVRVLDNRGTCGTSAGYDIDDTRWQPGIGNDLSELQRC
jgi:hypothetical protein